MHPIHSAVRCARCGYKPATFRHNQTITLWPKQAAGNFCNSWLNGKYMKMKQGVNEDDILTGWWDAWDAWHTWRKLVGWGHPWVKWLHAAHANNAINWALQRWQHRWIATYHALKDTTNFKHASITCNMIYTVRHALSTTKKKAPLVQQDDTTISILQKWTKIKIKL